MKHKLKAETVQYKNRTAQSWIKVIDGNDSYVLRYENLMNLQDKAKVEEVLTVSKPNVIVDKISRIVSKYTIEQIKDAFDVTKTDLIHENNR